MSTAKDDLAPEMEALKAKLKATWMSGDFDKIAQIYAPGAAEFVERLALRSGERVLEWHAAVAIFRSRLRGLARG
jgi:hypothetical protein